MERRGRRRLNQSSRARGVHARAASRSEDAATSRTRDDSSRRVEAERRLERLQLERASRIEAALRARRRRKRVSVRRRRRERVLSQRRHGRLRGAKLGGGLDCARQVSSARDRFGTVEAENESFPLHDGHVDRIEVLMGDADVLAGQRRVHEPEIGAVGRILGSDALAHEEQVGQEEDMGTRMRDGALIGVGGGREGHVGIGGKAQLAPERQRGGLDLQSAALRRGGLGQ